ncbi:MAG: class I SAM-dependent methyltransferase [Muribaculaceae bacterium]|nr:class I SAM-dependent methyltransferase [Muribaculaceae bacterium]
MSNSFDEHTSKYDAWFMDNTNVLLSEARLVAQTLAGSESILSVGCGSGLFEKILRDDFGINITDGIEPALGMAEIARKRGMNVIVTTAEDADFGAGRYDTLLFNGSPSYISDLQPIVEKAFDNLPEGGRLILIDVPKESGYGMMYNLAKATGSWDHPLLKGVAPANPYPIELVNAANWRTSAEKIKAMQSAGFKNIEAWQTLTTHPLMSDIEAEYPSKGADKGDYVAIIGYK